MTSEPATVRTDRHADPFADFERDGFMVFVPAIMSVGLIFSITTLARDAFHHTGARARERRTLIETNSTLADLLGAGRPHSITYGVLRRRAYLATALTLTFGSLSLMVVASFSYFQDDGAVRHMGWVLVLAAIATALALLVAAAARAIWRSWPELPDWTVSVARAVPLTYDPARVGRVPSWKLTAAVLTAAFSTLVLTALVQASATLTTEIDEPLSNWFAELSILENLEEIDLFGSTIISVGFVVLIGLSGFRCRVMALTYPAAFVFSWVSTTALQEIVERTRPIAFGDLKSYPSGHLVQAVFLAGLLPTAVGVLTKSPGRLVNVLRVVLGAFVLSTALVRTHRQNHWPLDTLGGVLLGLLIVFGTHWILEHSMWHQSCGSCPWSDHPGVAPWTKGLFDLSPRLATVLGWAGPVGALIAAGTLGVASNVIGLPTAPAGEGVGSAVAEPLQLGLAVLMAVAGLLAFRWRAPGAFLMAVSASGLGMLAAVEYAPLLAFALTVLLIVPAVITWVAWQPHETIGSISALALITVTSLTATAFGSREIYGHFFGPTHPDSLAEPLESDAEWLWIGAVTPTSATITAGGFGSGADVRLSYWSDNTERADLSASADEDGIARIELTDLEPATTYSYAIDDDGEADATFRTFPSGARNLTIAAGACARTGSNGAVFDQIVAQAPDLYLAMGDLHYNDIESPDPDEHLLAYGEALGQPGQSALFRSVPTAYVWDDHDFGPNDADSTSPSRPGVGTAYRQAVPHYGVDPGVERAVAQAFTIGRVRVVLTDSRSQRTTDTMLGADQLDWLIHELATSSPTHALVLWVNPVPWIGENGGIDDWSAYPDERRTIADAIAGAGIENLVMVSGDAHMVALDDGTNSGYASDGSPGFPVLHAAALDRLGSSKGGPYSHGAFPGGGQYGLIDIADDGGSTVTVTLSGHSWDGDVLVREDFEIAVPSGAAPSG